MYLQLLCFPSRRSAHATVEIPGNQANGEDLSGASGVVAQSPARNNDISTHFCNRI